MGAPDDFGIKTLSKSRTQFDGVTNEMQMTYLSLDPTQGVELPILSTGVSQQNIDFSIMFWFKIDQNFFTKSAPGGAPPQIMYLFSFEDSISCFFTDTLTLMCDSWDRRKLQISGKNFTPGLWYHMTISSSAKGESFLLIQDHHQTVAIDRVEKFGFRQSTVYNWKCCIGDCAAEFGFFGGIREFVLMRKAITQDEAAIGKNMILTYDSSMKAYFRFQDLKNKFDKDEFVDWGWISFKNKPSMRHLYVGTDLIPNDVCPSLLTSTSSNRFDANNKL